MFEFFNSSESGLQQLAGPQFTSSLLSVKEGEDSHSIFNFLDYYPLVNARVHRVGGMDSSSTSRSTETKQWILNENFRATYKKFIVFLVMKQKITSHDRLMLVNYLLLQERISESVEQF